MRRPWYPRSLFEGLIWKAIWNLTIEDFDLHFDEHFESRLIGIGLYFIRMSRVLCFKRCLQIICECVCCSVLQHAAACCSALQSPLLHSLLASQSKCVCCRVLQCITVCCSTLQGPLLHTLLNDMSYAFCSVLQRFTVCCACCSVLQCVAHVPVCCSALQCVARVAVCCAHCIVLHTL